MFCLVLDTRYTIQSVGALKDIASNYYYYYYFGNLISLNLLDALDDFWEWIMDLKVTG